MPSPFPGMNPYLEQDDVWHDFHEKFLPAVAEQLVPQVRPNYIVRLDEDRVSAGVPATNVERISFLKVQDRRAREVIAVVELLSPSNKRPGADREQYLGKRDASEQPLAPGRNRPSARRAADAPGRPSGERLLRTRQPGRGPPSGRLLAGRPGRPTPHHPDPPLRQPDPDARIDLQEVLNRVYDASGYEDEIYETSPEPPLSPEEAEWARPFRPKG